MTLKSRWQRAFGRTSSNSSITSSTTTKTTTPGTATPSTTNSTNNTDTASRLTKSTFRLSRTFMFLSNKSKTNGEEDWEPPRMKYRGPVSKKHQEMLEAFEWKFGRKESVGGQSWRSDISPGTSRCGSLSGGGSLHRRLSGRRSVVPGVGALQNEVHRQDDGLSRED